MSNLDFKPESARSSPLDSEGEPCGFDLNNLQFEVLRQLWLWEEESSQLSPPCSDGITIPELCRRLDASDLSGIGVTYHSASRLLTQLVSMGYAARIGLRRDYRFKPTRTPENLSHSMLKHVELMLDVKSSLRNRVVILAFKLLQRGEATLPDSRSLKDAVFKRLQDSYQQVTSPDTSDKPSPDEDCI